MRNRGQSMLEFAISFAGLIMFIYVFLNVWVWVNSTLVGRQQKFQDTRVAAGQQGSAGAPVGYARPPIRLVGTSSSSTGDGDTGGIAFVPPPPCLAAEPLYTQAQALYDEAVVLLDQSKALSLEIQALGARLRELTSQIRVVCSGGGRRRRCWVEGPFAEINATQALLSAKSAEVKSLTEQAKAKYDEAGALMAEGDAACP